jgi:hypothetical protein
MLRWLRRSDRLLAPFAVAIAAMVVLGSVDWWHADDEDGDQPAFHDHAAHHPLLRSQKASTTRGPEHCYLCHWLRTLHNGLRTASLHRLPTAERRQLQALTSPRASVLAASLVPARAPPA